MNFLLILLYLSSTSDIPLLEVHKEIQKSKIIYFLRITLIYVKRYLPVINSPGVAGAVPQTPSVSFGSHPCKKAVKLQTLSVTAFNPPPLNCGQLVRKDSTINRLRVCVIHIYKCQGVQKYSNKPYFCSI